MNTSRMKWLLLPMVLAALPADPARAKGPDFSVVATAVPAHYTGQCPVKITFHVSLTSKKSGLASVRMDASDDTIPNPLLQVQFEQPGTQSIDVTRSQTKSASGWVTFSLVAPAKGASSGKVPFDVACTPPAIDPRRQTGTPATRPPKHFSGVPTQQGEVRSDRDWNDE